MSTSGGYRFGTDCPISCKFSRGLQSAPPGFTSAQSSALGRIPSEPHQGPITHQSAQMMGISDPLLMSINHHQPMEIPARALMGSPARSSCAPVSVSRLRGKAALCCLVIGRESLIKSSCERSSAVTCAYCTSSCTCLSAFAVTAAPLALFCSPSTPPPPPPCFR